MNPGLEQVRAAVAAAVEKAGVQAVTAFSGDWAKKYDQPVVAVGLRTGESRGGALGSYLGRRLDPADQSCQEVYGLRMDLTLSVDIYAPAQAGAAGCDSALEALHQAALRYLPSGLKPRELRWEETAWDGDTAMFLRRGSLTCDAYFTATVSEEGMLLSDFILKGVVTR